MIDTETALFRSNLLNTLKLGPTVVTFIKKDGTKRVMECTLRSDLLPVKKPEDGDGKPKKERKKNENQCVVYDLKENDWRSFTYDSVTQFAKKAA